MATSTSSCTDDVTISAYRDESQLGLIQELIDHDLSEPYSIFTYRYFITQWPHLCLLALSEGTGICMGVVVCKYDESTRSGYIAMLAVRANVRGQGLGSRLVKAVIEEMMKCKTCDEVTLEAEVCNKAALALYDGLGFLRHKRLQRYYLNGNDAYRLKLRLTPFNPLLLHHHHHHHQSC